MVFMRWKHKPPRQCYSVEVCESPRDSRSRPIMSLLLICRYVAAAVGGLQTSVTAWRWTDFIIGQRTKKEDRRAIHNGNLSILHGNIAIFETSHDEVATLTPSADVEYFVEIRRLPKTPPQRRKLRKKKTVTTDAITTERICILVVGGQKMFIHAKRHFEQAETPSFHTGGVDAC